MGDRPREKRAQAVDQASTTAQLKTLWYKDSDATQALPKSWPDPAGFVELLQAR